MSQSYEELLSRPVGTLCTKSQLPTQSPSIEALTVNVLLHASKVNGLDTADLVERASNSSSRSSSNGRAGGRKGDERPPGSGRGSRGEVACGRTESFAERSGRHCEGLGESIRVLDGEEGRGKSWGRGQAAEDKKKSSTRTGQRESAAALLCLFLFWVSPVAGIISGPD